jgi:hypothetical protein
MNITPEIESTIDELIERWVPAGKDKYFHIEPRSYMKEMIMKLKRNYYYQKLKLKNMLNGYKNSQNVLK